MTSSIGVHRRDVIAGRPRARRKTRHVRGGIDKFAVKVFHVRYLAFDGGDVVGVLLIVFGNMVHGRWGVTLRSWSLKGVIDSRFLRIKRSAWLKRKKSVLIFSCYRQVENVKKSDFLLNFNELINLKEFFFLFQIVSKKRRPRSRKKNDWKFGQKKWK